MSQCVCGLRLGGRFLLEINTLMLLLLLLRSPLSMSFRLACNIILYCINNCTVYVPEVTEATGRLRRTRSEARKKRNKAVGENRRR